MALYSAVVGVAGSVETAGTSLAIGAGAALTLQGVGMIAGWLGDYMSGRMYEQLKSQVDKLKCRTDCGNPNQTPCDDDNPDNPGNPGGGNHNSGANNDNVRVDPSGFVYEGVPTNRLEGVTATVYYKELVEDMYGDTHENIIKWDAEEYGQENPLTTDKNGFYRWDVPQGLWQVKYEKEGYETTYSEWLPVPPPQLDVNIAMKQATQPNVINAHAYEDAVEFEFDKYMMPELLNTENISVAINGKAVDGIVELNNEEATPNGNGTTYASKARFKADEFFNGSELTLSVKNNVKSYAGVQMQDNFSQTLPVELEMRRIVCDSVVTVGYGDVGFINVAVLPSAASAGKMLSIESSSQMILATYSDQVELDKDGTAEIPVRGILPGSAALKFNVEGSDLSTTTVVDVKLIETVATPVANIASGTTVEKGTLITLSCNTKGATIYYTLNGSCPCSDTSDRFIYDGNPIVLENSTTILAMATAPDMKESEVAEFTYYVDSPTDIDLIATDENIQIFPIPARDVLNINAGKDMINSVSITSLSGAMVTKCTTPATYISLDIKNISPGIYVTVIETEHKTYTRKIVKVK
ncbi:MAG: chitobiase/beta-hexosaminidase C-terminal domain-containing protein [Lachnoclostridium sp.]|nr:chitobiase/beta-hexosaminidase C-terminal domain-containing protein [Lachnoclostridium sp.]